MSERRVPRPLVALVCALVFVLPAAIVAGAFDPNNFWLTAQGKVKHRDTRTYATFIAGMVNYPGLNAAANAARDDWQTKLQARTEITAPGESAKEQAEIEVNTEFLTNMKVMTTIGWHPQTRSKILFNKPRIDDMPAWERRARTCRSIGQIIGLKPKSGYADCMDSDPPTENSETVSNFHVDMVHSFYGPNLTLSGSLIDDKGAVVSGEPQNVTAEAVGHDDIDQLQFTFLLWRVKSLAGFAAETVPSTIISNPPCDNQANQCSIKARATSAQLDLADNEPGHYLLIVQAKRNGSVVAQAQSDFFLDYPYFGFNDAWTRSNWVANRTSQTHAFGLAAAAGANTARLAVWMGRNTNCSTLQPKFSAARATDAEKAYDQMISQGIRPIIVLTDDSGICDAASNHPATAQAGGCDPQFTPQTGDFPAPRGFHPADTATNNSYFQAFAKATAEAFPDALGIEVGNEVNWAKWWSGCEPDPARYRELLDLAYAGIDQADPNMPVLVAGMTPLGQRQAAPGDPFELRDWVDYLGALSPDPENDPVSKSSDATALHPYWRSSNCSGQNVTDAIGDAKSQIGDAHSIPGLVKEGAAPNQKAVVWVTEVGVSTSGDNCLKQSETEQKDQLRDLYGGLRDAGLPVVAFHSLMDFSQAPSTEWPHGTGVYSVSANREPDSPKLSYCELQRVRLSLQTAAC